MQLVLCRPDGTRMCVGVRPQASADRSDLVYIILALQAPKRYSEEQWTSLISRSFTSF